MVETCSRKGSNDLVLWYQRSPSERRGRKEDSRPPRGRPHVSHSRKKAMAECYRHSPMALRTQVGQPRPQPYHQPPEEEASDQLIFANRRSQRSQAFPYVRMPGVRTRRRTASRQTPHAPSMGRPRTRSHQSWSIATTREIGPLAPQHADRASQSTVPCHIR